MGERIILRVAHFMKSDDFEKLKAELEKKIPGAIVIPCTITVENLRDRIDNRSKCRIYPRRIDGGKP